MKNVLLLATLLASVSSVCALPTYDYFNYTAGQQLNGQINPDGFTWVGMNTGTSTTPALIASPGNIFTNASVPASFPTPGSNAVQLTGNYTGGASAGSGGNLLFGGAVTNGAVYASCYMTVTDITGVGSAGAFWATFNSETGTVNTAGGNEAGRILMRGSGTTYQLGITKSSGTAAQWVYESGSHNQGDVLFIVASYDYSTTPNNVVSLWINPSPSDFGAGTPPAATITVNQNTATAAGDINAVRGFALLNRNTAASTRLPNTMYVDDLHLGRTWAYVTGGPEITNNPPASANLALGSNIVLNVAATVIPGAPALTYHWQRNGVNLSDSATVIGSSTPSLTLTNVNSGNSGTFACIVANSIGSSSSSSSVVQVADPLIIQQPPSITNAPPGATAVISITASGTPTLTYVWQKNASNLTDAGNVSGSATANLTLSNISAADNGTYLCVVKNGVNSTVNSSNCVFSVTDPAITSQPQSATVNYGTTQVFSTAATGTPPFSYSWQLNGNTISDGTAPSGAIVSGSTTANLTLSGVSFNDDGSYTVTVLNGNSNPSTSLPATLTVIDPYIVTQPVDAAVPPGTTATFHVNAAGTAPLTYQWRRGTTALSNTGNFSGTTTDTLTLSSVVDTNSASYNVVVTGASTAKATSSNAVLTVNSPAAITVPPMNRYQHAGENSSLSVTATGLAPISYQWSRNGTPISGATTNTLLFTSLTTSDTGTYSVRIANSFATNSASATLTASPNYIALTPGNLIVSRIGDGAQTLNVSDGNTINIDQFTKAGAYVSTITIPDNTNVNSQAMVVGGQDASSGAVGLGEAVLGSSPDNHFVGIGGYNISRPSGATGNISGLAVTAAPRAAIVINGLGYFQMTWRNNSTYSGGSIRSVLPDNTGASFYTVGASSGLRLVSGSSTATLIDNVGSAGNNRVLAYFGSRLYISSASSTSQGIYYYDSPFPTATMTSQVLFSTNANSTGSITNQGQNEFSVSPDQTIVYFANGNYNRSTGNGVERWDVSGSTWTLSYAFSSNSVGARGLYVDWTGLQSGLGAVIYATSADTNNNYLIKVVDNGASSPITILAQAGTNQIFRSIAAAPIADGATIVAQPQNQRGALGVKAVFTVGTTGSLPINYQWRKNGSTLNDGPSGNGSTISGATSAALTISGLANGDVGSYSVVIGNTIGGQTSSSATLAVVDPGNYLKLGQVWAQAPGSQTYLPTDTDPQGRSPSYRSLAYNAVSNQVLIVSRAAGKPTVTVLDAATGATLYNLDVTGISGGSISLNAVGCGADGVVYACNVSTAGGANSNFKLYRWDSADPSILPLVIYGGSTDPGLAITRRWGDTLCVTGSEPSTQIMLDAEDADSTGGTTRGTIFTPDSPPWPFSAFSTIWTSSSSDSIGRSLNFAPSFGANAYIQKRKGTPLMIASYDLIAGSSTSIATYGNFAPSLGQIAFITNNLIAAIDYSGGESSASAPDYVDLIDASDLTQPAIVSQYPFPMNHLPNGDYNGSVVAAGNMIYALDSNNGLVALTLLPPGLPSLSAKISGATVTISWNDTTSAAGAVLQTSTTLTPGSWVNDPNTVNTANGQKSVTENLNASRFYRLIK